jgi:HAD superfamily hydrolase (TIGR01509 family)
MGELLIIFDCDGVLVDSEPLANLVLSRALNREGLAWDTPTTMRQLTGRSMKACVELVEGELGRKLPDDFVERLQAQTFQAFRDGPLRAIAHVEVALDALSHHGVPFCVASSGDVTKVRLTLGLTGLWGRFDGRIYSSTMVSRGKPYPDLFLHAAKAMGADPTRCVVIEDSVPGVTAARAAGMRALAYVGAPYADRAALAAAGGQVFDDMRQLASLVGLRGDTLPRRA